MTSIGLTWQLYTEIQRCLKWTLMVQMLKEFSISYLFEPIAVVTFCTLWWPQLHSTYDWPQVSSIYFTRFLSVHSKACKKCFTILHKKVWNSIHILFFSPHLVDVIKLFLEEFLENVSSAVPIAFLFALEEQT